MSEHEVFVVGAARTAVGSFLGGLSTVPAPRLGALCIRESIKRAGISDDVIDEVMMGQVLTGAQGQAPARQASIFAGLPASIPCTTIGKVCGSGLQTIILGTRTIKAGEADIIVAGGQENMTLASYALEKARTGYRLFNGELVDMMVRDGLWDVYTNQHMGSCADKTAAEYEVGREEQDDYATLSYTRAQKAIADGKFKGEIIPVEIPQRKGDPVIFDTDEGPGVFNEQKMRKLRPAFEKGETASITAGNASSINDGAGAVVLASAEAVKKHKLTPVARIVSSGLGARESHHFPLAPIIAVKNALARAGFKASDIDRWEINEAFAIVPILAMKKFDLTTDNVNLWGGAISIGHPIGASGTRIFITLLSVLKDTGGRYGLCTPCIGGGEGNAVIIEKL